VTRSRDGKVTYGKNDILVLRLSCSYFKQQEHQSIKQSSRLGFGKGACETTIWLIDPPIYLETSRRLRSLTSRLLSTPIHPHRYANSVPQKQKTITPTIRQWPTDSNIDCSIKNLSRYVHHNFFQLAVIYAASLDSLVQSTSFHRTIGQKRATLTLLTLLLDGVPSPGRSRREQQIYATVVLLVIVRCLISVLRDGAIHWRSSIILSRWEP